MGLASAILLLQTQLGLERFHTDEIGQKGYYPARRIAAFPVIKGTLARIVVPTPLAVFARV
jgi:hypothetical protein